MSYVITLPSQKYAPRVLHRESCKALHHRTKRRYLINGNHYMLETLRGVKQCPECIKGNHYYLARAEAWQGHLLAAHRHEEEARAEFQRWQRQQAAKAEFLAQFEPVRAACEIVWERPVTFGNADWNGNLSLKLHRDDTGWDVATIYLTAKDGARMLQFEGINHSTGLIKEPKDATDLFMVFRVIETWLAPEPLSVPEGAPEFYGIR